MEIPQKVKTSKITYAIFIFSLIVVLINLVSVLFPSLIITQIVGSQIDAEPFAIGFWFIPVLATSLALLGFGILYYKKVLPKKVGNTINFIFNFEVSKNIATIVVIAVLFGYIGFTMEEVKFYEGDIWGDFENVERIVNDWPERRGDMGTLELLHVKNFFLKSSEIIFQNMRVIPFIASIFLILLTYFFTVEITKKRFAGIIAMIIFVQSHTFLQFDTLATYASFWGLFFLLSLYLVIKKWYLSPISYIASLFSKPLTFAYLPMTLFFIYRSEISKKQKVGAIIPYLVIFGAVAAILLVPDLRSLAPFGGAGGFDFDGFMSGFTVWAFQLRWDTLFLLFVLPVTVGLFLVSRKGVKIADAVMFLMIGMVVMMPLMAGLTGWNLHPYRFVPLMYVFAIAVGTLFAKRQITQQA